MQYRNLLGTCTAKEEKRNKRGMMCCCNLQNLLGHWQRAITTKFQVNSNREEGILIVWKVRRGEKGVRVSLSVPEPIRSLVPKIVHN